MFKKMISLILAIHFLMALSTNVTAECSNDSEDNASIDLFALSTVKEDGNQVTLTSIIKESSGAFVVEQIAIIPNEGVSTSEIVEKLESHKIIITTNSSNNQPNGRHSVTVSEQDDSISMTGWVTSTYLKSYSNGMETLKLTKCSGGASVSDPTVQIISENVIYACSGHRITGGFIEQRKERNPSNYSSWSYNTPSSWVYVYNNGIALVGGCCCFTMKRIRGTSSHVWTLTVSAPVSSSLITF